MGYRQYCRKGELSRRANAVVVEAILIAGYAVSVWCLYGWPAVLPEIAGITAAQRGLLIALPLAGRLANSEIS